MILRKSVGVIVVCHPGYAHFARACIEAIDRQTLPFSKKVFVYDWSGNYLTHAGAWEDFPKDWTYIEGNFAGPNKARNRGLEECFDCEWVVFWDADNIMPRDYHAQGYGSLASASPNVAICYPDVQNVTPTGELGHRHLMPEWSHRLAQSRSIVDSASFWRVEAVCEAGGFDHHQVRHDDYTLALRIFRAGWKGKKAACCIQHLIHGDNRGSRNDMTDSLWIAYHFAFVTLWSGGDLNASMKVMEWLATADIPPMSMLYWVDNSGGKMRPLLHWYAGILADRFIGVTILDGGAPYKPMPNEPYKHPSRHSHVAYLYNMVLPMIREELIVTIEDDTIPPKDGIRKLLDLIRPGSKVAVAAGVYRSRPSPEHICASRDKVLWRNVPLFDRLPNEPFEVGMTGFGFALVANWAIQECLPVFCELTEDGRLMGWDGNLGLALTRHGYKLMVDPRVKASHLCASVIEWESCYIKPPKHHCSPY